MKDFITPYRDEKIIRALAKEINIKSKKLQNPLYIMEVCGGHTHTLMKYGLKNLLNEKLDSNDIKAINFIHGPGCPVCIMPKSVISESYFLAMQKDVILLTLGDMIKVPGKNGSLADARALGADVRVIYSPFDALKLAKENPSKKIVYFAIGFETTTPMSAALLHSIKKENLKNIFLHINHVLVPPPVRAILSDKHAKVNALIAPSHVSVISGAKIYAPLLEEFHLPIVISGFEPVDMLDSILKIVNQVLNNDIKLENQYKRLVTLNGNIKAQELMQAYFEVDEYFQWRGLGNIAKSSLKLKDEFSAFDAKKIFDIPKIDAKESSACKCGDILKGIANPLDCKVFGKVCTPQNPIGSCMVSSEGACAAYYKYGI